MRAPLPYLLITVQHGKQAQTLEIKTTTPLPYLLITAKAIDSEKVSLNEM